MDVTLHQLYSAVLQLPELPLKTILSIWIAWFFVSLSFSTKNIG